MKRALYVFGCLILATTQSHAVVVDLEDQALPGPEMFRNNTDPGFDSRGAFFNNNFTDFGSFSAWTGWAVSNRTDNTTAGYGNQYSAITGSGAGGSATFAIGFGDPNFDVISIVIPAGNRFVSLDITNTTYAALSMALGDSFSKKFGGPTGNDPDKFGWTITGFDASSNTTGSIEVRLADFTFSDNALDEIVDDWRTVDLSPLADAIRLEFKVFTTDTSEFDGIIYPNTPGYLAVDNLVYVPEASSACLAGLLASVIGGGIAARRLRQLAC